MASTTFNSAAFAAVPTRARSFATLRTFLAIAGASIRCAAAVESGYRPDQRDLNALGIGEAMSRTRQLGR